MTNKQRQTANARRRAEAAKKQSPLPLAEQHKRAADRRDRLAYVNARVNRELAKVHRDAALGKDRLPAADPRSRTVLVAWQKLRPSRSARRAAVFGR